MYVTALLCLAAATSIQAAFVGFPFPSLKPLSCMPNSNDESRLSLLRGSLANAWAAGDAELFLSIVHPNAKIRVNKQTFAGKQEIKQFFLTAQKEGLAVTHYSTLKWDKACNLFVEDGIINFGSTRRTLDGTFRHVYAKDSQGKWHPTFAQYTLDVKLHSKF